MVRKPNLFDEIRLLVCQSLVLALLQIAPIKTEEGQLLVTYLYSWGHAALKAFTERKHRA